MLVSLSIRNLALVDHVEIPLGPGLTVLTGETGAGKSVLAGSLSLLLGGRASSDLVRSGAREGAVEALFDLAGDAEWARELDARGIEVGDSQLVARRTFGSARGRVLLNGQMATLSMLKALMRGRVDVTGQHEHVSLLDPERHLDLLDAYGDLFPLRRALEEVHGEWVGYRAALESLELDEAAKARREDYLRFALQEIRSLAPEAGELDELQREQKRLRAASELVEGVRQAEGELYSDSGAVVEAVGRVEQSLTQLASLDEELQRLARAAGSILAELEDVSRELGRYGQAIEVDPGRLEVIEDRISSLKRLAKKHGGSLERVLEAAREMEDELEGLENEEVRKADLLALVEDKAKERDTLADRLSEKRRAVVGSFERAMKSELEALVMGKTRFVFRLTSREESGPRGRESAEIVISPNPGEPLRPLRKVASGGELSRVLLGLKCVLAGRTGVRTFVFDEIDTGLGGAVAETLGRKLAQVAQQGQVLCVTHLPQVAAFADRHLRIRKVTEGGRTATQLALLDEAERREELARMLGGQMVSDRSRELAAEMLAIGREQGPGTENPGGSPARGAPLA